MHGRQIQNIWLEILKISRPDVSKASSPLDKNFCISSPISLQLEVSLDLKYVDLRIGLAALSSNRLKYIKPS
jgi:hypothetical protein